MGLVSSVGVYIAAALMFVGAVWLQAARHGRLPRSRHTSWRPMC